jgi:hypothetical protein
MADLQDRMKQAVAEAAVQQIRDGMVVGLGSGSTAALMIQGLGAKLQSGELKDITGVTTSFQGEVLAAELGIPLKSLNAISRIDLAIAIIVNGIATFGGIGVDVWVAIVTIGTQGHIAIGGHTV